MSFHLAHIHDYNRFIAIDIGSYRVRAGVYDVSEGKLEALSYTSVRQDKKNMINGSIVDMRSVALTIERAIIQASKDIENSPQDIILSFSSPATLSDIITTQYVRWDKTANITMEEIDTIIKKIEAESFSRIRERAKREFGIAHDDIRLISSTITSISIDGKSFSNPLGSSGTNIRLTILNVFLPASDYNMIRSIVASLDKKIISLIPMPLVFPKIVEKSDFVWENTCSIDIGYSHTTIAIEAKNEITAFETFPIWARSLIEVLWLRFPDYSQLQIEHMIHSARLIGDIEEDYEEFLEYIFDIVFAFLRKNFPDRTISNIFYHGGIFQNNVLSERFFALFQRRYNHTIKRINYHTLDESLKESDSAIPFGLAIMAQELLLVKKDPLIRILRYILYNYE
jgi:cell division ATPase FtsA